MNAGKTPVDLFPIFPDLALRFGINKKIHRIFRPLLVVRDAEPCHF
jgi:hypothetical protein